jgi:hypothetical protein
MAELARSLESVSAAGPRVIVAGSRLQDRKVLNSWKEIAAYLDRGVRTVQRWHQDLQLPVHKVKNTRHASVFAYRVEIDRWLQACAKRSQGEGPDYSQREREATRHRADTTRELASKMMVLVGEQRDSVATLQEMMVRLREKHERTVAKRELGGGAAGRLLRFSGRASRVSSAPKGAFDGKAGGIAKAMP